MPFSRSRSSESSTRSATSWLSRNEPDCQSSASTSVVLPWSTCATMATFRRSSRWAVRLGIAVTLAVDSSVQFRHRAVTHLRWFLCCHVCMDGEPTVRQVYALAAALCSRAGLAFPESREAASELIERLRIENGHPGPAARGHASAPAAAAQARRGSDRPRERTTGGRARSRPSSRERCAELGRQPRAPRSAQAGAAARLAKTFSSAAWSPTATAPVRTAASPSVETSTRGGKGQPLARAAARSGRAAGRRSRRCLRRGRRARRRRLRRWARRAGRSGGRPRRRPRVRRRRRVRADAEDRARVGRAARRARARAPRPPRRDGSTVSPIPARAKSISPAAPLRPRWSSPPRTSACAHARPDGEEDEVGDPARDSLPLLAECGEVDVVLERHREVECCLELVAEASTLETGDVLGHLQRPVGGDDARHADDTLSTSEGSSAAASSSDARRRAIASVAPSASALASSTSWRARMAPPRSQTAPRTKRAPRSSPSTSAASVTGFEVDGAVAGAVRPALGLAHEAGVEQGLERKGDRRLRDPRAARDLGA